MLSTESKRQLLKIAREAIVNALEERAGVISSVQDEALLTPSGAFVTLRSHGALRGCIGYIESILPLANVVEEVAVKAAFEDPRFPPLNSAEAKDMMIEVSVLSPLSRVENIEEITPGVHGLLLELGPRRGLLLPQVATEYHWDRLAFLNATARKAGLPEDAWRHPGAKLYQFTAEIVEETEESQEARPS